MKIFTNIYNLLISPRFQAFYWGAGLTALAGFVSLLIEAIPDLGMPEVVTALVLFALHQATKALNNARVGKPMGFAPKNND